MNQARDVVLGIQTATLKPGVALAGSEDAPGAVHVIGQALPNIGNVEALVPAIDALLTSAGVSRQRLAAVAVASGPGSFSGVRIGCVTAQALAHGMGLALVATPTLDAVAFGLPPGEVPVAVLLPARVSAWYTVLIARDAEGWRFLAPPAALTRPEVVAAISGPVRLAAPADQLEAWQPLLSRFTVETLPDACYPDAAWVAALGHARWRAGQVVPPDALQPLYIAQPRITAPRAR